jgi:antitoxin component HigA of HigAB toxin-antitoxin module
MVSPIRKHPVEKSSVSEQQFDRLAGLLAKQAPERVDALFDEVLTMPRKTRTPEPIADTIKAVIRERKLSTYALGKMSGVSSGIISRWLNDERGLTLRTAERLAAALDLVLVPREERTM